MAVCALMVRFLGEFARLERMPFDGGLLGQPWDFMETLFAVQAAYSEHLNKRR